MYGFNQQCSNCGIRPPNPGRKWCDPCFRASQALQSSKAPTTQSISALCANCHLRTPNQNKSWCEACYCASQPPKAVSTLCTQCNSRTPNPGKSWCEDCFRAARPTKCTKCGIRPPNPGNKWCQQCYAPGGPVNSCVVELKPVDANKYEDIKNQFHTGMAKKNYKCQILAIYSVWNVPQNKKYQAYKNGLTYVNEKRWWHGSDLDCDLMSTKTLCTSPQCRICSILASSFLLNKSLSKHSRGRFGPGIYFAPDACKSNDYTSTNQTYSALVLSRVAVGKCMVYQSDQSNLTSPPSGYDSVLGEVGQGLNFAELVIYNESAVSPSYVVFYQK